MKFGMFQDSPELSCEKGHNRCGAVHGTGMARFMSSPVRIPIPVLSPKVGRWGEPLFDKYPLVI